MYAPIFYRILTRNIGNLQIPTCLGNKPFPSQAMDSSKQHNANSNSKSITIIFFFIFLLILINASLLFPSLFTTTPPIQVDQYLSSSSQYYCHLTMHPNLCYNTMSTMINTTLLISTPTPIFSTSLQIAINQLNNTTFAIQNATLSLTSNTSLVARGLSECWTSVNNSLSQLHKSTCLFRDGYDVEQLSYHEVDGMKASVLAGRNCASRCFEKLEEINATSMLEEEEKEFIEEVKMGVEKGIKCMVNSVGLLERLDLILEEFYNPLVENTYEYERLAYYNVDYGLFVCLYFIAYLFLAFLYFLFWRGN